MDSPSTITPVSEGGAPERSPDAPAAARELDRSLASSLAWRAAANWTSQIVTWASFLIVARLLSPADFGIVAMAVILFAYLRYVGEFGLTATIVTLRDITDDQLAQLNTIGVVFGLACFGLSCAFARPLALFFKTPRLVPVVIVSCSALAALGIRAVPEGLLERDMRFRWISLVDGGCDVLSAAISLVMAFLGFAYWSLVLGNLAAVVARSALIVTARPHRFALPRLASVRKQLLFGWHVLVSSFASSSYERLDNATAGRVLGSTSLGFYGMAWNLANVPLEKVTSLVTTVVHAYLAAVQSDPAALRRYVRTLTELMALATFPATVGLGLVAREIVPFALGRQWEPAVPPLEVLSVYAAFRSVVALLPKVLTAVGNARFVMWDNLAALAILPTAFWAGSHWGTAGIAWGWVVAYPLVALPLYWKTFSTIGMEFRTYLGALRPALDGTALMVLGVGLLKWFLPSGQPLLLRLTVEIAAGAVAYGLTILALHRERAFAYWALFKEFRRSKA